MIVSIMPLGPGPAPPLSPRARHKLSVVISSQTAAAVTYTVPPGWQIGGFHGRAGTEVDKLGVIYVPVR